MNPRYRMFAAALDGELQLWTIQHRAREVRHAVSENLFSKPWSELFSEGWRVVRVTVQKDDPVVI